MGLSSHLSVLNETVLPLVCYKRFNSHRTQAVRNLPSCLAASQSTSTEERCTLGHPVANSWEMHCVRAAKCNSSVSNI